MRKIVRILLNTLAFTVALYGCGGGGGGGGTPNGGGSSGDLAPLMVTVKDETGAPVPGATVSVNSQEGLTDTTGLASFSLPNNFVGQVMAEKAMYLAGKFDIVGRDVDELPLANITLVKMKPAGVLTDVSNARSLPVTLVGGEGASITIKSDNPFVDSDGTPYTGKVQAYITSVDFRMREQSLSFIGDRDNYDVNTSGLSPARAPELTPESALRTQNAQFRAKPYGVTDFTIVGEEGESLALAEGEEVDLKIPLVFTGRFMMNDDLKAGDVVPVWFKATADQAWQTEDPDDATVYTVGELSNDQGALQFDASIYQAWGSYGGLGIYAAMSVGQLQALIDPDQSNGPEFIAEYKKWSQEYIPWEPGWYDYKPGTRPDYLHSSRDLELTRRWPPGRGHSWLWFEGSCGDSWSLSRARITLTSDHATRAPVNGQFRFWDRGWYTVHPINGFSGSPDDPTWCGTLSEAYCTNGAEELGPFTSEEICTKVYDTHQWPIMFFDMSEFLVR